jgi:asparagine synthase (glutamine-hydrolysing)
MALTEDRALLVIRERARGSTTWCSSSPVTDHVSPDEYHRRSEEAHAWPLGYVLVELSPGQVQITASQWGVAPVHLATADGTLRGSWDLVDLVPYVDARRFDPPSVIRFLTYATHYSCATLLADVLTVTERATATWSGNGVTVAYPEPAAHALPRELAPGADPVGAFEQILQAVIERWEFIPDQTVTDLSGGMDSTNVGLALAQLYPGQVHTGAMLLDGPMGDQQVRRRRALLAGGFGPDHTMRMVDHLPFNPKDRRRRGLPFDPQEGPYAEARDVLLADYAAHGKRVLFSGLGGDEAMKLRAAERERFGVKSASPLRQRDGAPAFLGAFGRDLLPHRFDGAAPIGPTLWSILDCFGAFYPQHMRHGIWPINPFAAPEIVRLAESLPAGWRHRKRLLRDRLVRLGFSQEVSHPERPENFQHILDTAMRRHGVDHLLEVLDRGSLLVDDGYLDADELARAATEFKAAGARMFDVYRPLILETGLASLQARR